MVTGCGTELIHRDIYRSGDVVLQMNVKGTVDSQKKDKRGHTKLLVNRIRKQQVIGHVIRSEGLEHLISM